MNTIQENSQPKGIQEDERDLLIDYYVQKVEGRLRQLRSPSENDKKRWVWELLQNAKDTISALENRSAINVEVELKDDFVTFKHNGAPFTNKALNSLKWQKSGEKRGNAESTGRFGTGFLTTHTLSSKVDVKSILVDKEDKLWGFEMTLYRDGERDEELRKGIKKTLDSVKYSNHPTDDWTTFTYNLESNINKESAIAGVKNLESNIYFTLAFVAELKSIRLTINERTLFVKKIEDSSLGELNIVRFSVDENGQMKRVSVFFLKAKEYSEELTKKFNQERSLRYSVAIQVLEDAKEVIPISPDTPHLYCDFPLVGTEDFHFPVVLNSRDFEPVTERDRLLLDGNTINEEKQEITNQGINKKIISKSLELYRQLLTYLSENGWGNIHLLANGARNLPAQERDFDKEWYKENIQSEIRAFVKQTPIVETSSGLQKLDEIYFPQGSKKEISKIWEFTNDVAPNKLPKFKLIEEWSKLIWKDCHNQTIEELAKQVSEYKNLNSLGKQVDWLNRLLAFIVEKDSELLNQYSLIPNVKGEFKPLDYEGLSINNELPDTAFKLLNGFGVDWEDVIVSKGIDAINLTLKKGIKELSTEINDKIKDSSNAEEEWEKGILNLIAVIPTKGENISDDFINKRKSIWKYSKDIFREKQPEKFEAENLVSSIWEKCDELIFLKIIEKISSQKNLRGLSELNNKLDIFWLNEFIGFAIDEIKSDILNEENYKILPNQNGEFIIKSELSKDDNIPELLKKDVIVDLGINLKHELLDKRINNYIPEKSTLITEVATRINDLLKKDEINVDVKDKVVFHLTAILPTKQNSFQNSLWEYSRIIYGDNISAITNEITNFHSTLWSDSNQYLVAKIVNDIESFNPKEIEGVQKNSISLFAEYLKDISTTEKENWEDFTIFWLSDFISFLIQNEYAFGQIVPNQNNNFDKLEGLNSDDEIPEILKDILALISIEKDFRKILIHRGISTQPSQPKNTKHIISEIDNQIKIDYKNKREDDNFKEAVKLLVVDWFDKAYYPYSLEKEFRSTDSIHRNLFEWAFSHRFELETNVLSSIEDRKHFYRINSTIREQNIPFEEAVIIHQSEYEELKNKNETLVAEVKKLREEKGDDEAENLIKTYELTEDRIKLLLRIEEIAKRNEGSSNFLEQSAQELINQTGIKGEEIVYNYLVKRFVNKDRVLWVSRADKNVQGRQEPRYDFEVLTPDLTKVMWFIDAKATTTREQDSDKIPILIRKGTWDFIRENTDENIFLARVFGARNENPNKVQLLKIKYEKN